MGRPKYMKNSVLITPKIYPKAAHQTSRFKMNSMHGVRSTMEFPSETDSNLNHRIVVKHKPRLTTTTKKREQPTGGNNPLKLAVMVEH